MSGRIVNVRPKTGFIMDAGGDILPLRDNVVQLHNDRLTNVMSGRGTTADPSIQNRYLFSTVDPAQVETAYRSSWLWRKIIDIPALDMTRSWRNWQTDKDTIQKLEAEEKRLQLKAKCKRALTLSRLFGGGALLLGTNDEDPMQPHNPSSIKAGGLTYVHVFSRHQLSLGPQRLTPGDQFYGKPEYFEIRANDGGQIRIHPSRIVEFIGQPCPEGSHLTANTTDSWFWGDPLMQSIGQSVKNADLAQDGFAALIDRASVDVFKFKDLMSMVGTQEGEDRVNRRVAWSAQSKSTYRAMLLDMEDDWQQVQVVWNGIPLVIDSYTLLVAGAADIPMTRLLGQSPKGLQSTGDGEERDYQSMISARQDEQLVPALDRIDELLIPSALGSTPSDIYYTMGPLQEATEKDAAAVEFNYAQAWQIYANSGEFQGQALSEIAKNRIIESGRWPGAETAFEQAANEPLPAAMPSEADLPPIEKTPPAATPPVKDAAPEPPVVHVTVPVEVHMPKGGGTRTVVTKHTKDGRIAEFEQRPVEEEE